jgi:hypothetical protein
VTLFPYAKDLEYRDGRLSFTLQFFDNNKITDINLSMELDDDLATAIETLMEMAGEF